MAFLFKTSVLHTLPAIALPADAITALLHPASYRTTLLDAIAQAQQRIYIAALYLEQDEAGQEILAALYQAKQQRPKLDIVITVDWHRAQRGRIGETAGYLYANNAQWYQQQAKQYEGISIPVYGIPIQTRELFGVFHLKGFVIDDVVLYSGASLNNIYLYKLDKYRLDRYHLITSPVLAQNMVNFLQQHFIQHAATIRLDQAPLPATRLLRKDIRNFREALIQAQYPAIAHSSSQSTLSIRPIAGLGKGNLLSKVVQEIMERTHNQLFICTPYFNFPRPLMVALARALKRGVQIDIVVGDKTANDFYTPPEQPFKVINALPYLYEMNLRRFAKRHWRAIEEGLLRIHLWQHQDNSYHAKGLWSDQRYILLTGSNLNPRASRLDMENALLIHDPQAELQTLQRTEQTHILQHTRPITSYQDLESVQHYPEQVKKLITRLSRVRLDRMLNLML